MKNLILLVAIIILSSNCKPKESNKISDESNVKEYPVSDVLLDPFDPTIALESLGLEELDLGKNLPDLALITPEGTELERSVYRTEQSSFDVIYYRENGPHLIRFYPDIDRMFMMTFLEPEAVPDSMIKPGNVWADLKKTYPGVEVEKAYDGRLVVRVPQLTFVLDAKNIDPKEIPPGTRIQEITAQGQ
ncbi:hypothetical protein [Nonlabens xiamenensis]|uniref:hypothetical protein n=1 Tax=Nonlabens xiamenensis TaxID=2341043 RepID=UPI000F60B9DB|nr:hypothetical protein [Nonlabens xiamenensis]